MTEVTYYRGRDLKKEVAFVFTSLVHTTPRDQLENFFADRLVEKEKVQNRDATAEIELAFLRDTLSKIRASLPLAPVIYPK